MTTSAEWQRFEVAYSAAVDAAGSAGTEAERALETYLAETENITRTLGVPSFEPSAESIDNFGDGGLNAAAASAAADLDLALKYLSAASEPAAAGFSPQAVSKLDLSNIRRRPQSGAMPEAADEETPDLETLQAALRQYSNGIVDDAVKAASDVGSLVTEIGIGAITGAAGTAAHAIVEALPKEVSKVIRYVVQIIGSAIDKLRKFFHEHFAAVEKAIADWWKDTVGDKGFGARVLKIALSVDILVERRNGELEAAEGHSDRFPGAISRFSALRKSFDDGDEWVSKLCGFLKKIWALILKILGPQAALVGGAAAAALIAFVVGRAGDFVDWESVGPLKLPTWLDVVHGPQTIVNQVVGIA
jgi:hypothetical protein